MTGAVRSVKILYDNKEVHPRSPRGESRRRSIWDPEGSCVARKIRAFLFPFSYFQEDTPIAAKTENQLINNDIRFPEVRLIGSDGSQLGIVPSAEARRKAEEANLDLVCIAPQAEPPVCKIMDFGKYRYEKQKREKEASRKQSTVELKEIRLGLNIDVGDFETKVKQARKFIADGNKLKLSIRFRGRELAHTSRGNEVMDRFAEAMQDVANVEKPAKMEGRSMQMTMGPKPAAKAKKS